MRIAVIAAMDLELEAIRERLQNVTERRHAGQILVSGAIGRHELTLTDCGIGKVNAARSAQLIIDAVEPAMVLHCGIAGGLDHSLAPRDVVLGRELVYHDFPSELLLAYRPFANVFASDHDLVDLAAEILEEKLAAGSISGIRCRVGRIATGDEFVASNERRQQIVAATGALAADMESAAVAQVCYMNELPCLVIRSISDLADDAAESTYEANKSDSARVAAELVVGLARRLP
ncbi:MAG: 5'-methylthioadenosine/adenosylhomocysteine nucleosidase [Bacillota bacterium]|nr:5'-methylthioadenosine/adenosylhomocysteine nucleosidase [Bacillota bacterium]